jgi:hypothetical protein
VAQRNIEAVADAEMQHRRYEADHSEMAGSQPHAWFLIPCEEVLRDQHAMKISRKK